VAFILNPFLKKITFDKVSILEKDEFGRYESFSSWKINKKGTKYKSIVS